MNHTKQNNKKCKQQQKTAIQGPATGANMEFHIGSRNALSEAIIDASFANNVYIDCGYFSGSLNSFPCQHTTIIASDISGQLIMYANSGGLFSSTIYCPNGAKSGPYETELKPCQFHSITPDYSAPAFNGMAMLVYAVEGLNDLNIDCQGEAFYKSNVDSYVDCFGGKSTLKSLESQIKCDLFYDTNCTYIINDETGTNITCQQDNTGDDANNSISCIDYRRPSQAPTHVPTAIPTIPSIMPTSMPTNYTDIPTSVPTNVPSMSTQIPSIQPTGTKRS